MKYLLSISLLIIYVSGTFRSSWILMDFYLNRDELTMNYCQFLDQGITQCGASCYLEELLAQEENDGATSKILPSQKPKVTEISTSALKGAISAIGNKCPYNNACSEPNSFDYHSAIFRPPIA